jgi:hypothetical protein
MATEHTARRAELVWEGKYDAQGRRVGPLRVALPFQTVETVNESAQERQMSLLRETGGAYAVPEWRNRLIWGDKKYVLPSLLPEFAGKVNLIYIDPPFDTGADFSFTATVPGANGGAWRYSGESGADSEEEVTAGPGAAGHLFDDVDLVVRAPRQTAGCATVVRDTVRSGATGGLDVEVSEKDSTEKAQR